MRVLGLFGILFLTISCGEGGPLAPWSFIDGGGEAGINRKATGYAYTPVLASVGSRLYAGWIEDEGGVDQFQVAAFTGSESSPAWTSVSGAGLNGINANPTRSAENPQLTALGSRLYATWQEHNGTITHIRVAVFNGNLFAPAWTMVDANGDNGLNKDPVRHAGRAELAVFNSKLYATWNESNSVTDQTRVAVYNGNDSSPAWTFVDGNGVNGLNLDPSDAAVTPRLVAAGSRLYATWRENSGVYQVRVAAYNGNDSSPAWTFVDGGGTNGLNKNPIRTAADARLAVLGSKLYATWSETNGSNLQIRVAVFNGNVSSPAWSFVDGNGVNGINGDPTRDAVRPQLIMLGSQLFGTWIEDSATGDRIRIALYGGNDSSPSWSFAEESEKVGINLSPDKAAAEPDLAVMGSKLYATWLENNAAGFDRVRVAVKR